jgi:hypothetical protein
MGHNLDTSRSRAQDSESSESGDVDGAREMD